MNAIKAKDPVACCSSQVMLYLDGELEVGHVIEMEAHLQACGRCTGELELIKSMRMSLRSSCTRRAPCGLEGRAQATLAALSQKVVDAVDAVPANQGFDARRPKLQWAFAAVAVAACFAVVIVFVNNRARNLSQAQRDAIEKGASAANEEVANDERVSVDALLDELVSQHANPLPPEERNADELTRLEPYVGVPVRRPALTLLRNSKVENASASFDGARIHRIRNSKNAAALSYQMKGHRMTIYVFDPNKIPIARTRLRSKVIHEKCPGQAAGRSEQVANQCGSEAVYVGELRGFSVVAAERQGIGYALASDLDEDKGIQMVASF